MPGMSEAKTREVLLHEILHACWELAGIPSKYEEDIVNRISPYLLDVLQDNPDLLAEGKN